jgi:hypothetical protein
MPENAPSAVDAPQYEKFLRESEKKFLQGS